MDRRSFTKGVGLASVLALPIAVEASPENPTDTIPFVNHDPQAHRDAINSMLLALGGPEHAMPQQYFDSRTVLPEIDPDNLLPFLVAVRRALINGGIGMNAD